METISLNSKNVDKGVYLSNLGQKVSLWLNMNQNFNHGEYLEMSSLVSGNYELRLSSPH